jgi:hypothetical protein
MRLNGKKKRKKCSHALKEVTGRHSLSLAKRIRGDGEGAFIPDPLYPLGLPFWQLCDTQILEVQIRRWIVRL